MTLFKRASDLSAYLLSLHNSGKKTGFVPTMGALHPGHMSLVQLAKKENEVVVCSIFVNPTQFNDRADFEKYPNTIAIDLIQLEETGCDIVFYPSEKEIYGDVSVKKPVFQLGFLEEILEGKYRPGHFQGVCQVVSILLDIVKPGKLYLGQKDYQQCMVIKKLLELRNDEQVQVRVGETVRELDGLAMSSRNMRLDKNDREIAVNIFKALAFIKNNIQPGDLQKVKTVASELLTKNGFRPDYVEIADAETLGVISKWDGKQKLVALIAAFLNDVRLIDNMILN
jgi:pantoate--beta-alanine ligase